MESVGRVGKLSALLLPVLAIGIAGCSLLFDFNRPQCEKDEDCSNRGGEFADTICVHETADAPGLCMAPTSVKECTTNADCTGAELCQASTCLNLKTSECPLVLGEEHLRAENPILIGGYAYYPPLNPEDSPYTLNYELALDEFSSEEMGLPGGPDGSRRPFAILICDASSGIDKSIAHLVDDVHVAGIIAALDPKDLRHAFETKASSQFMLSPSNADSSLTDIDDSGLIWTLNPSVVAIAPVYQPLLDRVAAHLALTEPLRIAIVSEAKPSFSDLGDALAASLTVGGTPLTELGSARYKSYSIDSDPQDPNGTATLAVQDILTRLKPHVIISTAGASFGKILTPVENAWAVAAPGQNAPFYVLSYSNAFDPMLLTEFEAHKDLAARTLGVNFATADDRTLYYQYLDRLKTAFPKATGIDNTENLYDAAYFMLYSYAAAGSVGDYAGNDLVRGMKRLIAGSEIDVGPLHVGDAMAVLTKSSSGTFSLYGTLGPPEFDAEGVRQGKGAVYCVDVSGATPVVQFDVLKLDTSDPPTLVGDVPCFAF